ncbi:F-box protein-like protein [Tanacetum coccineum]
MADYDHQSSQSANLIGSNDDLLTEILRWLPVISILRFKSVSKHWRSLLTQRLFTLLYDNGAVSPGFFVRDLYIPFDVSKKSTPPFSSLDFYPDSRGIKIAQSCNGLLLCCSNKENHREYYVFNPTTKQFAIIPPVSGGQDAVRNIRFMVLAYHETECPHYKVICIHRIRPYEQRLYIQIYSSDTRKWKKISNESFWASYYTPFSGGVYWNGAVHWAPSSISPSYFKLDVEKLQVLPLPLPLPARVELFRCYTDGARPLHFGVSQGHLHLVDTAHHENHLHLNVYEMLSDHSGWFVKYLVELDDLVTAYPKLIHIYQQPSRPQYYEYEVLDVIRGEKEEDTFMMLKISKKIIRYNILDKSFEQIFDLTDTVHGKIGPWDVHRYTKTLASF